MVLVHVGEDDEIKWRQFAHLYSRISYTRGVQSIAQVGVIAAMQEIWIGQDGEACIANNYRSRPNKKNRASIKIRPVASNRQNQFFCTSHMSNGRDHCLAAPIPVAPPFMLHIQGLHTT